jgi:diguanylate cyclase (GGDEF)-like protein
MPDVARQRMSSNAESVAQRDTAGIADNAAAGNAATASSRSGRLAQSWPSRPIGPLVSLVVSMRSVSVRRLVGTLGAMLALATALLIPIGYGVMDYWKDAQALAYKADLSAARAATSIQGSQDDWRSNIGQLRAAVDMQGRNSAPVLQRITDAKGTTLLETGDAPAWPTYSRAAPIVVGGIVVGWAEMIDSLRPMLIAVAVIALVSLSLAVAAYYMFATLPLKLLDRSLSELERANARFRQQNLLLDAALGNMFQGLAMFDAGERLVIANDRFAEMYRLTPDQVRPGTPLRQILAHRVGDTSDAGEAAQGQLQALREHFACRKVSHLGQRLSDGRTILVSIRPMREGGWVTTHQDVTERENLNAELAQHNELLRQREDELEERNKLLDAAAQDSYRSWSILDAALNNMLHGLAMFDAEHRLIVCNKVYYEMYGLTAEQVAPGTMAADIVLSRVTAGNYGEVDAGRFIDDWLASGNNLTKRIRHLADGRIISVCRHKLCDGRLLVTHEDITEREQLYSQLARQNALLHEREDQLKEHNEQFDAALRNMSQGLCMFDEEQRLVICNELFAHMYGLTFDQVEPGTPLQQIMRQQIANGCQTDGGADELLGWLTRRAAGEGPSQLVCELADGRSISVSAQKMPNGGIVTTHQDITEQRYAEARIVHMALHDSLTELPNRTLLNERLEHALTRVRRGEMVAVHTLDLDHFKTVNDTLGHPVGDKLLKQVTERLLGLVRETDTVARMGGDEFAIVQVAISQPADATTLAHRIIEVVSKPYDLDGQQIDIGASIGIAMAPTDGDTPDDLLRNSDLALYRAKGDGRGTFCFFESDMDAQMQARRALECDLQRAVPAREFELHYQPVIDLRSNQISSFEALVRWRHPRNGLVPPGLFIPLAEKLGIIVDLGEWAIRDACMTARSWPRELSVAVNLSPRQFRNPGLLQIVSGALENSGLPPHRLELDITEPVLMGDSEATLSVLRRLRELGVKLAMDDFGTGYASLSYLHSFAFDKIKIDRSFVKSVAADTGSLNVVRAVAAMAHSLGMSATAEGVETLEQLEIVRSEGCTEIQGFLFSPALPASEIDKILKRRIRFGIPAEAENAA